MISERKIPVCEVARNEFPRGQFPEDCIQHGRYEILFPLLPLVSSNDDTRVARPLALTASFFFRIDRLADFDEQKFSNIQSNP
jgi:hypothetical protein